MNIYKEIIGDVSIVRGRSSNGRALDSKSNGCGFKSRRPHFFFLFINLINILLNFSINLISILIDFFYIFYQNQILSINFIDIFYFTKINNLFTTNKNLNPLKST